MINTRVAPLDVVTKNHLNVLIQLAHADKHIAAEERDMIFRVGKEKNFPEDKVEFLMQHPEPVGTLGALSPNQKLNYLLDCVELAFIDDKVEVSEMKFCQSIAMKMGLRMSVIDFLVENRSECRNPGFRERVIKDYFF
jgi:hypothetical protein